MAPVLKNPNRSENAVQPLCPIFGTCGGCLYQNIAYPDELKIKEQQLQCLLKETLDIPGGVFMPIVPSPNPYHYRNRLDMQLKRTRHHDIIVGFTPIEGRGVVPAEACSIADRNISDFIPELKRQAAGRLPAKYRNANLTVRAGDDGRVLWGGIGRRSCRLKEQDYFWTAIQGKRIFYSLDTFFQPNLSILPQLFDAMGRLPVWDPKPVLYDLYAGVGLFAIGLSDCVQKAVLIEENVSAIQCARRNVHFNQLNNVEIRNGTVEDVLPGLFEGGAHINTLAMIDPPRAGLSRQACRMLAGTEGLDHIFYLSCNSQSLARDLHEFVNHQWAIQKIIPFDFFPKTKHLETLVLLKR